jgi:hypothetical protein
MPSDIDDLFEQGMQALRREKRAQWQNRRVILLIGVLALALFVLAIPLGYPGAGLILVPIGLGSIIGITIEMLLARAAE